MRWRNRCRSPIAITVLRDGRLVITAPARQLNRNALVQYMVGREVAQAVYGGKKQTGHRREKVLSVENVTMAGVVKNMSFSVYAGEVVGIAGLIGSGRTEIAKIIFGALKRNLVNGGTIRLRGKPIRYRVPRQAIDDGIAYITEDRKANGFFETMIVDDNVYIGNLGTRRGWSFLLSRARRAKLANYWVDRLKINALQRKARIVELSGGNQQKVVLAKTLVQDPQIIIFDEPTRGVDVGTIPHNPRRDPQARRRGQGGGGDLVLSAGDSRCLRPHPGRPHRADRRRIRCRRRHPGQDSLRRGALKPADAAGAQAPAVRYGGGKITPALRNSSIRSSENPSKSDSSSRL